MHLKYLATLSGQVELGTCLYRGSVLYIFHSLTVCATKKNYLLHILVLVYNWKYYVYIIFKLPIVFLIASLDTSHGSLRKRSTKKGYMQDSPTLCVHAYQNGSRDFSARVTARSLLQVSLCHYAVETRRRRQGWRQEISDREADASDEGANYFGTKALKPDRSSGKP